MSKGAILSKLCEFCVASSMPGSYKFDCVCIKSAELARIPSDII